jgi:uncharacterized membrane protein
MGIGKVPQIGCLAVAVWIVAAAGGLGCGTAEAKSYYISQLDVTAQLHPDGSMEVTESRTYGFEGSFSFAYRDLPTAGPVVYGDFGVSENGRPYRLSDTQDAGTYTVTKSAGRIRVTWYYRAEDEARTFDFHYRAQDAVKRYQDAAVLYFKFLDDEWTLPQHNITITLRPPIEIHRDRINEWVHGPLWAESRIRTDGTIMIYCRRLPANEYLEIRALYPPDLFGATTPRMENVRSEIMAAEARWAEEANREREQASRDLEARARRAEIGKYLIGAVCAIGVALWVWLYRAFRRRPDIGRTPGISSEIPEQTPPALLDYLLNFRRISAGALVGTMLDLARRGLVKLREEQVEKRKVFGGTKLESEYYWDLDRAYLAAHEGELADYESALLRFIFDDLAEGGDSISLDAMKKKRRDFVEFFRAWTKQVEAHAKRKGWFDLRSIRGFYISLIVGIAILVLAIPAGFLVGTWAAALIVVGGAILVLSFIIPHRTAEGEQKAVHWKAVQRYLKKYEFRSADRSSLLEQISDYLVYGVVLGLSTKIYEELASYMPEGRQAAFVPWYVYAGGGRGGFSPAAFGQAFSSMVATATSSMSTAAGTGGGASAGGGGGAGSGGGGAG